MEQELILKMEEGKKLAEEARAKGRMARAELDALESKLILGTITDEERKTLAQLKGLI